MQGEGKLSVCLVGCRGCVEDKQEFELTYPSVYLSILIQVDFEQLIMSLRLLRESQLLRK